MLTSGLWGQNALMSAALDAATDRASQSIFFFAGWSVPLAMMLTAFALLRVFLQPVRRTPEGATDGSVEPSAARRSIVLPAWTAALAAVLLVPVVAGPDPWLSRFLTGVRAGDAGLTEPPLFTLGGGIGLVAMIVGISAAWAWRPRVGEHPPRGNSFTSLVRNRFYLTEVLAIGFVAPVWIAARLSGACDRLIDALLVGLPMRVTAAVERGVMPLQNGLVQFYGLSVVLAAGVLLATVLWLTS